MDDSSIFRSVFFTNFLGENFYMLFFAKEKNLIIFFGTSFILQTKKMPSFRSNCYGFVYAGLQNSEEEYFKNIDDLNLKNVELKGKIDTEIIITTDAIKETFALSNKTKEWKILQLFDHEKRSQHVAFIDAL